MKKITEFNQLIPGNKYLDTNSCIILTYNYLIERWLIFSSKKGNGLGYKYIEGFYDINDLNDKILLCMLDSIDKESRKLAVEILMEEYECIR